MKIRRIVATAVAAAVTTPIVFLSAAPAFADTKPAAQQTQDQKSDIEKLQLAVTKAQTAYDAAVVAVNKLNDTLDALAGDKHPLVVAAVDAKKASDEAAAAKTAADAKLDAAQKALAELPADATEEQKTAAQQAVTAAETEAAAAKTTAETKAAAAKQAQDALDDARVAAARDLAAAQETKKQAAKELDAAKKALEAALEEEPGEECEVDKSLVTSVTGPKTITAGASGVFTFRITNKGKAELGEVGGYAEAFNLSEDLDKYLHLTWSSSTSPKWQPVGENGFASSASLKPGKSFDFKLKVAVDSKAPAGDGIVVAGGAYINEDGSCGYDEDGSYAEFGIVKAHKPAPGTTGGSTGGNGNTSQQGGQSTTPVTTGTTGTSTTATGSLAKTGAGSSTMPIALAGGAAVVLGAGAMVMVRRRKAGADA
ncbi:LPXTG cell wall anchor domain-containing protein [Streptomyces sp. NPDC048623]|uniref:LPXTG cell wall anchor domain-containing protein n=1 Tax=Streptomyces sp. NPDC048623 TaxID=3155761 RepID=UPI003446AD4E